MVINLHRRTSDFIHQLVHYFVRQHNLLDLLDFASPTNVELANGSNWELVNTGGSTKQYIDHKGGQGEMT